MEYTELYVMIITAIVFISALAYYAYKKRLPIAEALEEAAEFVDEHKEEIEEIAEDVEEIIGDLK